MDDLAAFLAARLDEDEAALRAVEDNSEPWRGQWAPDEMNFALRTRNGWSLARAVTVEEGFPPGVLAHIARNDPARALREVEAKRGMLGTIGALALLSESFASCLLTELAAVYNGHPDYRPEWAPEGAP